ncbi:MAG TPA: hypothetical protein VHI13_22750 [Candidatus Kapabacteria bacterium]|nr:hypothetical protein [Candidatus Kapabacteria bacterium]
MHTGQRIISLLLVGVLASCSSPIDIDTKRIDTRLTNYVKLQEMTASVQITRPSDTTVTSNWLFTIADGSFRVDTSVSPPRLWLNYHLVAVPGGGAQATTLKELRVRIDGMRTDSTGPLGNDPDRGSGASARFVSGGMEFATSATANANATLHYLAGADPSILGTVVLGMNVNDSLSVFAVLNFRASRD